MIRLNADRSDYLKSLKSGYLQSEPSSFYLKFQITVIFALSFTESLNRMYMSVHPPMWTACSHVPPLNGQQRSLSSQIEENCVLC